MRTARCRTALRLQFARRGFTVERPYVEDRENRFASAGWGVGGGLGIGIRLTGRFGVEVSVARDRLSFGEYRTIQFPGKRTGATWSTTSLRAGVTTRL